MFERERAQEYSRQAVTAPLTSDHGVACGPPVGTRRVARRLLGELALTMREPVGYGSEPPGEVARLGAQAARPCSSAQPRYSRREPLIPLLTAMADLLEQFVTQECTAYVRRLIEDTIVNSSRPRPHFEFNRFEITIERQANIVVLKDVLDATDAGVRHVPLAEFTDALRRCSG
jgi:hypothetical protein